ncbi:caspase family protein [Flavobacterium sp.]|uniref:caspase family protein n=1 Tax=Flavobacterium sp. TaxID=239 RepID=UPI0039E6D97B
MQKKSLIIGINHYQHFSSLDNCVNDAEDIHSFLINIGFDSTQLLNPSQAELIKAVSEFKNSITENTISLIFFSGHGLQDERYNYLVASDSEVRIIEDIKYNCFLADDLLIETSKNNLHMVILDACRNNPFYTGTKSTSIGLVKMAAPAGTLIAFSTSPNSISIERNNERNGVFTKFLLKNMKTPNLPVELVFKNTRSDVMKDTSEKQIPWEESSLFGNHFYFIETEEDSIDKLFINHLLEGKTILLPELRHFLKNAVLETESLERLIIILTLVKISFSNEQEGISNRTVDEDYFSEILIDEYYPKLQERLIKEDEASEPFGIKIFNKIKIVKNINFGYNFLNSPDESFPQMMVNYIKMDDKDGILCFYLSASNNEYFLKPVILSINQKSIEVFNYSVIKGDKVNEILDFYFNLRKPFEKAIQNLEDVFKVTEIDEEEFNKMFKSKKYK